MVRRPLLLFLIFFMLGIFMKDVSSILILFIPFIITFLIYLVYKGADPVVKKAMIKSSACIFAPFMLIMGFFIGKSAFQETSLDKALELKEKGTVSGIIKDVRLSKEYLSVTVTDAKIEVNGQVFEKSKDVLAYVTIEGKYGNTTVCYNKEIISDEMEVADYLKPGSEVSIEGKLSSFSKPTNPGQFDQWSYRKSQGYAAKISSKKVFISERGETSFLRKMKCGIYGLRRSAYKAIEELFPERESGIIKAMLLADKGDMEEDTYLLFSDGGITHILAVSGLHVSLFAGALLYLAGILKMGFYPSIALTAVFLFSYGLLTGFPVSALRAITMTLIMLFGRLTGKSYDALTGAAITAFMILVKNPLMLYNPSFLLSFGAVAGIFLFQPLFSKLIKGCFGREYKWLKKESLSVKILIFIMEGICLSFSVTLMTLPIVLWFYFKVSVYAVLLNLVIVPLMTLLLILIAAAISLFYVVLPAARIIAGGPYFILTLYERLCSLSTSLPGNSVLFGRPEKAGIVIYYAILMAVYVMLYLYIKMYEKEKSRNYFEAVNYKEEKLESGGNLKAGNIDEKSEGKEANRTDRLFVPIGMVLMFALFTLFGKPRVSDAKIAFLDVGQGDGSVILTKNLCITIDGGSTSETNVGKYRIKPYIMSNGRNVIDYAFISHSDTDHLSGILELIEDKSFKVKMIVLGDITEAEKDDNYQKLVRCAEENGTKVGFVSAGMSFELDGVTALCLNPQKGKIYGNANDTSEVFFLKALGMNFLYTGDLSAEFETDVINELRKYTDEKVDVLKAGHHGSKNSSSLEFLSEISPNVIEDALRGNILENNKAEAEGYALTENNKTAAEGYALTENEKARSEEKVITGLAVLSAGKGNSYGHPSKEAMERLIDNGYYLHSTIENGALIIE